MKKIAMVFAGGTGQRMGSEIPKQFLKVSGKEIIIHTLELFENNENVDEIYVACIEDWIPYLNTLIKKYNINKVKEVFPGGKTGQDSIFLSLQKAKYNNDNAIVLVHDGVRPLVSDETITNCIMTTEAYGNAITVTPCYETPIKSIDGKLVSEMPQRQLMYTAQAPQCFYLNDIYGVHLNERRINPNYEGIVDSCGLMFNNGIRCHLVYGNRGNIKVTTPEDFCTLLGNFNARDYSQVLELQESSKKVRRK